MQVFTPADLSAEALAQAGLPPELVAFMFLLGVLDQEPDALCDCPPGTCLGEQNASFNPDFVRDSGDETDEEEEEDDDEDEFEIEFEPDFELSQTEEMTLEEKSEAVAQLGRIIEGMTLLVEMHAALVKELVL